MISRRQFMAGLGAASVVGFNSAARAWVDASHQDPFDRIPPLDGEIVTDPASLAAVADDVGHIIHKTPVAILRPGSVDDIRDMVRFCLRHDIKVGARGQGHTTFGQSQVEGGLVIDTSTLNQIHSVGPTSADVGAGVKWIDLLNLVVPQGLTPPVLTGYTALSVGGTLSVGGISSTTAEGVQVDRVKELEVVTGTGQVVRCSEHHRRDLFEAMLAGLGQCGIITRAVIDLVPAKQTAREFKLHYTDNATFFRDMRLLLARGEFNDLANIWFPDGAGGWIYQLNAVKFFNPGQEPNNTHLLRGLSFDPSSTLISDSSYLDYVLRVDAIIGFFRQIGLWENVLHPWFDIILPDREVEQYVADVVPTLAPEDVGLTGFLLLFPIKKSKLKRPLFRVPEGREEFVWLFDILTAAAAPGPNPTFQEQMISRNRRLFEKARRVGGTRYPIGVVPFDHIDWIRQYGREWFSFASKKRRFDPRGILTPGPGIF
jgi:cytokinin dehydrogenase